MKSVSDILFVIQARLGSQRVPNKMLRPFSGTSLFEIALNKLTSSSIIPKDNLYASVYEPELKSICNNLNVNVYDRSQASALSDNDLRLIYEWYKDLPFKYVVKLNGCSPLLRVSTIDTFIETYLQAEEEGMFGVIPLKDYFWNNSGQMITHWPQSQTIMNTKTAEPVYRAAHVLYASPMSLIGNGCFMSDFRKKQPLKLFELSELECFDIDYEWQFTLGEYLYQQQLSGNLAF